MDLPISPQGVDVLEWFTDTRFRRVCSTALDEAHKMALNWMLRS